MDQANGFRNMGAFPGQARGAFLVAAFICGCACSGPRTPRPDAPVADGGSATPASPEIPTTLRFVIDHEPSHLNPDVDPDRWAFRIAYDLLYESLIRRESDGRFVPLLADDYSAEEDGRCWRFHLRQGVRFHDGKPCGPADVVATFERLLARDAKTSRVRGALADLERVQAVGGDAVRLCGARPSAYLLAALAEIGVLPAHALTPGDLGAQALNRRPIGTGPFRLASWERGKRIVLQRQDDYWGPRPQLERLEFLVVEDGARALGNAKRDEVEVVGRVSPWYVPEYLESATIKSSYDVLHLHPTRFALVVWNTTRPPLDRPEVRLALSQAIDRNRLLIEARHGLGRAIDAPVWGRGETTKPPTADVAAAATALDNAGLLRHGSGPRLVGARPWRMTLLVPSGSHEASETGRCLAETFGKLGVVVDLASGELASIMLRMKSGQFDGALLEWTGREDDDLAPLFHSRGAFNYGGYQGADGLLDALRRPGAASERRNLFARLAATLANDAPALFLYQPEEVLLWARRLGKAPLWGDFLLLRDAGGGR